MQANHPKSLVDLSNLIKCYRIKVTVLLPNCISVSSQGEKHFASI